MNESSIRLALLLIGLLIIAGILWDTMIFKKTTHSGERMASRFSRSRKRFNFGINFMNVKAIGQRLRQWFGVNTSKASQHSEAFTPLQRDFSELPEAEGFFSEVSYIQNKSQSPTSQVKHPTATLSPAKMSPPKITQPTSSPKQRLIILNVMARQPGVFTGKKIYETFHHLNFYFGEMQIFHRHENLDGSGEIVFSISSAVEPGIFEISKMETFVTPGLSLFFTAQQMNQSIAAFELMLRTGKQLAARLDGELRDQTRKIVTPQIVEAYRDNLRTL